MLKSLLGFVIFGAFLALIAFNFKAILNFGQAQLIASAAQNSIQAHNWKKAIEVYENGLRESPKNQEIALELGWLYQQDNRMDQAVQIYRSILNVAPGNLNAQMGLAQVFSNTSHFNEALIEYRKILRAHPDNPEILSQVGNVYKMAAENPQETREAMREWLYDFSRYYYQCSLKQDPKQFRAYFNVGVAYQQQKNLQPAAQAYCQALLLHPNSYEARFNLGLVLSDLNYLDEAYRQMGQAVQLASDQSGDQVAMQIAQRVQNIKNNIYYNSEKLWKNLNIGKTKNLNF